VYTQESSEQQKLERLIVAVDSIPRVGEAASWRCGVRIEAVQHALREICVDREVETTASVMTDDREADNKCQRTQTEDDQTPSRTHRRTISTPDAQSKYRVAVGSQPPRNLSPQVTAQTVGLFVEAQAWQFGVEGELLQPSQRRRRWLLGLSHGWSIFAFVLAH
jgi:hypothetical protein